MNKKLKTKLRARHLAQVKEIRTLPVYPEVKREFEIEYQAAHEPAHAGNRPG